jgi:hypothetical protein
VSSGDPKVYAPSRYRRLAHSGGSDRHRTPAALTYNVLGPGDDRQGQADRLLLCRTMCVVGHGGLRTILMLTIGFKQVVDRETRFALFFPIQRCPLMPQSTILQIATAV